MADGASQPSSAGERDLRIAVDQFAVRLVCVGGDSQPATFFLHLPDRDTPRSASLGARLNDPASDFIPCRLQGGTCLVRLDWIAYLELEEAASEIAVLEEVGARSRRVELDLVTGEQLEGSLLIEGGEGRCRVSDYLNRVAQRFMLLRTETGAKYVHRNAIALVRFDETNKRTD